MKLIDILVQELPKRGGWPGEAASFMQDGYGCVFYRQKNNLKMVVDTRKKFSLAEDYSTNEVTREQYEAAMKQQVWDGTGLPPVGVECEYTCCESNHIGKIWHPCVIKYASNYTLVIEEFGITGENIIHPNSVRFRPIRSEIDKKRSEGVIALSRTDLQMVPFEYGDKLSDGSLVGSFWYDLYDAIAAGKIPGVKLSD